jgi:hypothetical protein
MFWAVIDVKKIKLPNQHWTKGWAQLHPLHEVSDFGGSKWLDFALQPWRWWSSWRWLYVAQKWTNPFFTSTLIVFGLYHIIGDLAYPNNDVMLSVFKGNPARLPPPDVAFNNIVCPLWTSVEWGYENTIKY